MKEEKSVSNGENEIISEDDCTLNPCHIGKDEVLAAFERLVDSGVKNIDANKIRREMKLNFSTYFSVLKQLAKLSDERKILAYMESVNGGESINLSFVKWN